MRVIAGTLRGMKLSSPPKNNRARPTEDKTKESVFNIIQPIKKGAICLDLFAATGQIGIEFISRGASFCVFSEKSRQMIDIIQENVKKTKIEDRSLILYGDFKRNLLKTDLKFDYVYIDPPFKYGYEVKAIQQLKNLNKLKEGASLIVESSVDDTFQDEIDGFTLTFKRVYKSQTIRIYREC